jgi:predicted MPP superfamily phosphohydrolase
MTEVLGFHAWPAALAALVMAVVGYGVLIAPRRFEVSEHQVPLRFLPSALAGLRVVHLTDLHVGPLFGRRAVKRVVALANACRPDVVVLTGDFASFRSLRFLAGATAELGELHARLGVFACVGNHDHWEGVEAVCAALRDAGVTVLVNESARLADGLWLAGVDDRMSGAADPQKAVQGVPVGAAVVLLSHNPTILPEVAGYPWLVLSGHTHGGQIALPILGARRTATLPGCRWVVRQYEGLGVRVHGGRFDAVATHRYPTGWYHDGQAVLYVSRGIGLNQTWPLRLNCPPEIACLTLTVGQE